MNELPKRKAIRIEDYDYSTRGHISLRSAPQTERKSSGLTVGANCVRPPMYRCRILELLYIMKSKS